MAGTGEYPGLPDEREKKAEVPRTRPYRAVDGNVAVVIGEAESALGVKNSPVPEAANVPEASAEVAKGVAVVNKEVARASVSRLEVPETGVIDSSKLEALSTSCYFNLEVLPGVEGFEKEGTAYNVIYYREDFVALLMGEFEAIKSGVLAHILLNGGERLAANVPTDWLKGLVEGAIPDHGKVKVVLTRKPIVEGFFDDNAAIVRTRVRIANLRKGIEGGDFSGYYAPVMSVDAISDQELGGMFVLDSQSLDKDDFEALLASRFNEIKDEKLRGAAESGKRILLKLVPAGWLPCFFPPNKPSIVRAIDVLMTPMLSREGVDSPVEKYRSELIEKREAIPETRADSTTAAVAGVRPVLVRDGDSLTVAVKKILDAHANASSKAMKKPGLLDRGLGKFADGVEWIFDNPGRFFSRLAFLAVVAYGAANVGRSGVKSVDKGVQGGEVGEKDENVETLQMPKKPFAVLLEQGRREFDPNDMTKRDKMLKADRVIEKFLAGKFKYLATETGLYPSTVDGGRVEGSVKQEIYRFTMIGKLSGHTTATPGSENAYQTTTLADAVNTLLEPGLTDEQLKTWLCWLYETSFNTKLEAKRLAVVRDGNGVFVKATYDPPADFARKRAFWGIQKMDEKEGSEPGGRDVKIAVEQNLLGEGNRLLLPSGLAPYHDVRVPATLLKADPVVSLKLGDKGGWQLRAADFASRIEGLEKRMKESGDRIVTTEKVFGNRTITVNKMAPLIDTNDPLAKTLVDFLLKGIEKNDHAKRITAIIEFIQQLPYKLEYASEFDRPGLLVLLNEGGDCNNVTDLYVQLMAAAGYDSAVLWVALKDTKTMLHARGGIPAEYFPDYKGRKWGSPDGKWWIPIELTGKFPIGKENWGEKETTFMVEPVQVKRPEVPKLMETYEIVVPDGKGGWKKLGDSK